MINRNQQRRKGLKKIPQRRVAALEERLPGIQQIEGSYQRQTLTVDYDDTQLTEEEIRDAVRQAGYSPA